MCFLSVRSVFFFFCGAPVDLPVASNLRPHRWDLLRPGVFATFPGEAQNQDAHDAERTDLERPRGIYLCSGFLPKLLLRSSHHSRGPLRQLSCTASVRNQSYPRAVLLGDATTHHSMRWPKRRTLDLMAVPTFRDL